MTPGRSVDVAMEEERPEKTIIRQLWLAELRAYADRYPDDVHPLFLTLPGRLGLDVRMLIDEGLLAITDTGAIAPHHHFRVIGVERDGLAVAELNQRFPGLKILGIPLQDLLAGDSPFSWPAGRNRQYCKARVVNLDFNGSLLSRSSPASFEFPLLVNVHKLAQLHADPEPLHWTLCLTLHGSTPWSSKLSPLVQPFIRENLGRDSEFRELAETALGAQFLERLTADSGIDFRTLPSPEQQRLLMVFVPKHIAQSLHGRGWRIVTKRNLRYGDEPSAPMVTWMIEFVPDASLIGTPDAGYRDALRNIFACFRKLSVEGGCTAA